MVELYRLTNGDVNDRLRRREQHARVGCAFAARGVTEEMAGAYDLVGVVVVMANKLKK